MPTPRRRSAWCRALLALAAGFTPAATAQCDPTWAAGEGTNGTNGFVFATTVWDPDGPGPTAPLLA
ncbi:MAG TPA: hypothetical protein VFZ65_03525, partial [Planctomycetota bacterium]|nr:hypothetical protein [Planctomycetota bacterium]